jgi:hypothetical protein
LVHTSLLPLEPRFNWYNSRVDVLDIKVEWNVAFCNRLIQSFNFLI